MAMGKFSTTHSLAALAVPLQAQPQSFPREAAPGCPPPSRAAEMWGCVQQGTAAPQETQQG